MKCLCILKQYHGNFFTPSELLLAISVSKWRARERFDSTMTTRSLRTKLLLVLHARNKMSMQYGDAQLKFIKKVRSEIDKEKFNYFQKHDWHNICPSGGRFDSTLMNISHKRRGRIESFYVKAIVSWVPHLLFHNHVPCCPHCKRNDYVAVDKGRWMNSPKILYCLHRHKYLDTWLYG
jgi:hypothetical protein